MQFGFLSVRYRSLDKNGKIKNALVLAMSSINWPKISPKMFSTITSNLLTEIRWLLCQWDYILRQNNVYCTIIHNNQ